MKLTPPARVILDVGAQILELSNLEVARRWLALSDASVQAVVFFDEHDELSVINRKDRIEVLQTSYFAMQLDVCLVFLDESHTRGTDLRLPETYRAAVTLGAGLTKDRLTQGKQAMIWLADALSLLHILVVCARCCQNLVHTPLFPSSVLRPGHG